MTIPSKDHILKRLHPLLQAKPDDVRFSLRHLLLDLVRVEVTTSVVVPAESHRPHVTNLTQKAAFFSAVTGSPGRRGLGGQGGGSPGGLSAPQSLLLQQLQSL